VKWKSHNLKSGKIATVGTVLALLMPVGVGSAQAHESKWAAPLLARYESLQEQLANNSFQRPLYMESGEIPGGVNGEVFARIDHPYPMVAAALSEPAAWCDILILHPNTKFCRASSQSSGNFLDLAFGPKYSQPLEMSHRVKVTFEQVSKDTDYLQVRLAADKGPLNTRNYQIRLEAIPISDERTFLHLTYANSYGLAGRLAIQAYLGTLGSQKVGFTVSGSRSDGKPRHIGGLRGMVERNSMRYFLAIEAYLGALSEPPVAQIEKRLRDWFTSAEQYPRQLHGPEWQEYLDMKRTEVAR
jgi:hypothetical protein